MVIILLLTPLLALAAIAVPARACETGLYRSPDGLEQAALTKRGDGSIRYTLADGRRGQLGDAQGLLHCKAGVVQSPSSPALEWQRVPLRMTESRFASHSQTLSGVLIEPPGAGAKPLVVMVHGSERTSPRESFYPYILAAHGLTVFAYDKRGTGQSEGEYTQNFELLADDAAAAFREAKKIAAGRTGRAGFFGGSQGGWIAPLAATRAPADFVAVGFGLLASPLEEDRDQVLSEMRSKAYAASDIAEAQQLAEAAGKLVQSNFTQGFEQFDALKRRYSSRPWFRQIQGEYTGDMLRMSDADLRRIGRALFDNLELIWDHDSSAALRRVRMPIFWVLAEDDREVPPTDA